MYPYPPLERTLLVACRSPIVTTDAMAGTHLLLSHIAPDVDAHKEDVLASVRESYKGAVEFAFDGMRVLVSSTVTP
jgi:hypothetical protein